MTSRTLKATVPATAAELIERLGDEPDIPRVRPDILSVSDIGDGLRQWVLAFRGGTARWVQRSREPGRPAAVPHRIRAGHAAISSTSGAAGRPDLPTAARSSST